ncbi:ATPase [Candidatus Woesearchaeota archaeon]|nr:MAG: ATPase [Candidatus Woesearchaeota archaeon]
MAKSHPIVPDTSILIEGALSKAIEDGALKKPTLLIHEASVAELEHQANEGREVGYLGLDELGRLQALALKKRCTVTFIGERPGDYDIAQARAGAIDALIRDAAAENGAVLHTADVVQATVARAKGLPVELHEFAEEGEMGIESFFDKHTMSVHLKEGCPVHAKKGRPGQWDFVTVRKEPLQREEVERFARAIVEAAQQRRDGFVEIERPGSTVVQVGRYRIVITRPPFSDGYEITAVRPVKRLTLDEYKLSPKLRERLNEKAEGILIAGAPGHGKSTFAQGLAEHYAAQKKIIKTVEAPRDLILSEEITQYAMSHGSPEEIHDILLLSRPDYTIFDEMRNTDDFKLYADMRLSGVGMIGVIHATETIDAIQRFLGRIELGVIPHVLDTVIFIKNGAPANIYSVRMTVKVPSGMTEADLARPVVEVLDFENNKLEFEIYTYGEQTVVMPVRETAGQPGIVKLAAAGVREYFEQFSKDITVEMLGAQRAAVTVPANMMSEIIGRGGERIKQIEQELGIGIDLREGPAARRDAWYDEARRKKGRKGRRR